MTPTAQNEASTIAHGKAAQVAKKQREWCLQQIRDRGQYGATSYELVEIATPRAKSGKPVEVHRITPRLSELSQEGLIEANGKRPNSKGNPCTIWVAVIERQEAFNWHPKP